MSYACTHCGWHGREEEAVDVERVEYVDNMHDRPATPETFVDLYCPECGAEVEEAEEQKGDPDDTQEFED